MGKATKSLGNKIINLLIRPSHLRLLFHDLMGRSYRLQANERHLEEAVLWLCRAQDVTGSGGVAAGYYPPYGGWLPPYPETSGYIIPTFLRYYELTGDPGLIKRAVQVGDWEMSIQLDSGAVRGGVGLNDYPSVFNTGQVIVGWAALYQKTNEERFLKAAKRAADWIAEVQDEDGKWSRYSHFDVPHVYDTRVAWPVLEVYALTEDEKLLECGRKNVEWALSQSKENGWFKYMAFKNGEEPLTHTTAYTMEGLIESAPYLDNTFQKRILRVVTTAMENIMLQYERRKKDPDLGPLPLYATMDSEWQSQANYSCLTGNAQLAIVWLKLFQSEGDARYLNASLKILDHVKSTQSITTRNHGIRGAIPGSYPYWGKYNPFSFPSWATKFFADALMLQESILKRVETN